MKQMPYRFSVCGKQEIEQFADQGITHLLSLEDPETPKDTPGWFMGEHLQLYFHDVESADEARLMFAAVPTRAQVAQILEFGERCLESSRTGPVHLLVHCFAGISRSTAASYALICQALGPGQEEAALVHVQRIRREAFPNRLIVAHADHLLQRDGRLLEALDTLRTTYPYASAAEAWEEQGESANDN